MAEPIQPTTTATKHPGVVAPDYFERVASSYEDASPTMKDIACHLLALSPPLTSTSVIHDTASGPGIVTGEILKLPQFAHSVAAAASSPPVIHATDYSPAMVSALEARAKREGWPEGVVKAQVMDSTDLSAFPDDMFSHTYMAAAIFIVPYPVKAMTEIKRTLKPGGVVLLTTIEKNAFLELFQDVQRMVRPELPAWKGPAPEEWSTEGKLRSVMEQGGFEKEKVEIQRHSTWVQGETWAKPGLALLRETCTRAITEGWNEGARAEFEEKLMEEVRSQRVKEKMYEMKVFVGMAKK